MTALHRKRLFVNRMNLVISTESGMNETMIDSLIRLRNRSPIFSASTTCFRSPS